MTIKSYLENLKSKQKLGFTYVSFDKPGFREPEFSKAFPENKKVSSRIYPIARLIEHFNGMDKPEGE